MVSKVDKTHESIDNKVREHFRPPIYYVPSCNKHILTKDLIKDLELVEAEDPSGVPLMDYVFTSSCSLGKIIRPDMTKLYTTDIRFIKDTKKLIGNLELQDNEKENETIEDVYTLWKELKTEIEFREKYHYLDWDKFEFLNNNDMFLQILSVYNLAAPLMALLVPFFMILIPFFIMQAKGTSLSFSSYFEVFKEVAKQHAIGKLFTSFADVNWNERLYLILSAGVYCLSLYQNSQLCIKFYNNMYKIHDIIFKISDFIKQSIERMTCFMERTAKMKSYKKFNKTISEQITVLKEITDDIDKIHPFGFTYKKISDMGVVMQFFYNLYNNSSYESAISYAFGFYGYIHNMECIKNNISKKRMSFGSLREKSIKKQDKKSKNTNTNNILKVNGIVYPPLMDTACVKNDISIDKDCIITGPNASGKTTTLKAVLLNIIFTQQYGCGFYQDMVFTPYNNLHCYLNVPDTSGRDSLFQSESRKCKKIIEKITKSGKDSRHFCLFDELYSGTNPKEAVKCGYGYLSYLCDTSNVQYMLTTHYKELCIKLKEDNKVKNYKMDVNVTDDNSLEYTYNIKEGINDVDGGIEVLRQMNYPSSIINKMSEID